MEVQMFKVLLLSIILVISLYSPSAFSVPVVAGSVEITPINATLILQSYGKKVQLFPTVKFSIKNQSSSDIKLILISSSVDAYDNLNQKLFNGPKRFTSSGIPLSSPNNQSNAEIFINDKSSFVTLSPGQQVLVYIEAVQYEQLTIRDPSGDFFATHRPSTMTFNAAIGIINIDGSTDVRAFSIPDIPITVTTTTR